MALWRARLNSHGPTAPRAGSKRSACRHSATKTSWTTSWANRSAPGHLVGERVQRAAVAGIEVLDGPFVVLDDAGQQGGVLGAASRALAVDRLRQGHLRVAARRRDGTGRVRARIIPTWSFRSERARSGRHDREVHTLSSVEARRADGADASGSIARPMFATLLGALPRPPLPADAPPEALLEVVLGIQADHGLEPLTAAGWGDWTDAAARTDRLVKGVVDGPWTTERPLEAVRLEVLRLVDAGCTWIEVHEPLAGLDEDIGDAARRASPRCIAR